VSRFAVGELKDPDKEKALLHSLEKGNIQSVTIEKDGFTHKIFLEANPQFKTVNLFDAEMKRVQKENIGMYQSIGGATSKEGEAQKQAVSKDKKQEITTSQKTSGQSRVRSKKKSVGM
jgi:uncharacterized protein YneR